jgi:hypothetical protein
MKEVQRDRARRGTDGIAAGSGQVTSSAGPVTLARRGTVAFTAGVAVRRHLQATLIGPGLLITVSALLLATVTGARPLTIALVAAWGLGLRGGASGRAELDGPGDAGQRRRRRGLVRVGAARLAGRRLGGRRPDP